VADLRSLTLLSVYFFASGCTIDINSVAGLQKLDRVSRRVDAIDFEVSSRGETLWGGVAKVSRMRSALYSTDGQFAPENECAHSTDIKPSSYKMTFRADKAGGNANDPDTYSFDANIERSDLQSDCKTLAKTSSRAIRRYVRMLRGQTIEITGEDALRVSIHRQ